MCDYLKSHSENEPIWKWHSLKSRLMWIMLKVTKLPPFPNDHPHSSSSASSWSFQVIQMNMEIALVCAQLCVMAGARAADNHDLVNIIVNMIRSLQTIIRWSYVGWSQSWLIFSTQRRSPSCSWRHFTLTGVLMCIVLYKLVSCLNLCNLDI